MNVWKITAAAGALVAVAGVGAALAPTAQAQTRFASLWAPDAQAVHLLKGGGRLGVTARDVTDEDVKTHKLSAAQGVVIDEVRADSAASKAGFKAGDVVLEFDGERVRSVRQFTRLVQETAGGRPVAATVMRDGQRTTLKVEPSEGDSFTALRMLEPFQEFGDRWIMPPARPGRPPSPPSPPPPAPPAPPKAPMFRDFDSFVYGIGTARLGISLSDLSPQLAEYFGSKDGVLVTTVNDNSAAAKAGVKAGDVITAVNGASVQDAADVRREIQRVENGAEFALTVVREKKTLTLKGKIEDGRTIRRGRVVL